MFKSMYRKLKDDFAFVSEYGYNYWDKMIHHERPSVRFKSSKAKLRIGYGDEGIYVYRYIPVEAYDFVDLLDGVVITGNSYKKQVEQVKDFLRNLLDKESGNV